MTNHPNHKWTECRTCVTRRAAADHADGGIDDATLLMLMTEALDLPRLCLHQVDDEAEVER